MSPAYEAITASWLVKLFIYWGSWLVWPLLAWALWCLRRQWPRQTRGWRVQHLLGVLLLLGSVDL